MGKQQQQLQQKKIQVLFFINEFFLQAEMDF